MANSAFEDAVNELESVDKSKASESATILEFIKENLNAWKKKKTAVDPTKNLFSQQDSEA